jgi:hypothetical protein
MVKVLRFDALTVVIDHWELVAAWLHGGIEMMGWCPGENYKIQFTSEERKCSSSTTTIGVNRIPDPAVSHAQLKNKIRLSPPFFINELYQVRYLFIIYFL